MAKRKTGLGADAFFKEPGEPETTRQIRATILFYPEDYELLQDVRGRLRRKGKNLSQSEIIREALRRYSETVK